MRYLYLGVLVVLVAILVIRIPAVFRGAGSRMTWWAVAIACLAMVTLGLIFPIQELDALLGGTNVIWLVQCILATFAFWAFSEAARSVEVQPQHRFPPLVTPVLWCVAFTIPFLLNTDRGETVEHFSRVYATNTYTFISAVIYMMGLCWLVLRIINASWGRNGLGHRLFVLGSVGVILGCLSEAAVMLSVRSGNWGLNASTPWYFLFEIAFYPGVALIAAGMGCFWLRRNYRQHSTRHRADELRELLRRHGICGREIEGKLNDTYAVYALLVLITDHRVLGDLVLNDQELRLVEESENWVEQDLPRMLEAVTST